MPNVIPEYVRLADHARYGCQVDIETGWGISGNDVRRVPESPEVQAYVAAQIRKSIFQEATADEWNVVHAGDFVDDDDTPRVIMVGDKGVPENKLRHGLAKQAAARVAAAPPEPDPGAEPEADPNADIVAQLSYEELKTELKARDLPTNGKKDLLAKRLRLALAEEAEDDGSGTEPDPNAGSDGGTPE